MNPAAPVPPRFSLIDSPWPHGELDAVLQRIALALLDDLLRPPRKIRPQLAALSSPEDFAALDWWWAEEPAHRLKTQFAPPPSPRFLPASEPVAAPPHLLAPFWNFGSARAWSGLEFGQRVAERLGTWVFRRWVILPGEYATPHVSPRTWAVLLCLADPGVSPKPPRWWKRLWRTLLAWLRIRRRPPPPRDLAAAWVRAQKAMESALLQQPWAGFWDQWLIRRALLWWPLAGRETSAEFRSAFTRIPWGDTEKTPDPKGAAVALAGWERSRPPFLSCDPVTLTD